MRIMNMVIIGSFALFATALAIYTSPVGTRTLTQWALNLGLFSSAALTSWLFLIIIFINPVDKVTIQVVTLISYIATMISSVIAGASFSVVYLLIEKTNVNFIAALQQGGIVIFVGYGLAVTPFLMTAILLKYQSAKIEKA
ncbi:hypothetical protein [Halopseudomonas pelagia]|uniref:hypothetical protein n=1 Tax=Halopseudomonas pelagia TaxID=553151 RepID=UPI0003B3F41E|nr:hypothetical protein [Halopseudomonas pelagia]